jgi:diadenylate cyclase
MNLDFFAQQNLAAVSLNIGGNIFVSDILDIIFISIFIYIGLFFLKYTKSAMPFLGVVILLGVYTLAQIFNLHLTSLALQYFFGMILIIFLIIFQEEIRRFFEYLASMGSRQIKSRKVASSSKSVNTIVQAVANLAHQKKGAILILPGKESIDRHLSGGEQIDGIVSAALIESIFDPKSPGHDGAVVIVKDRVTHFGVQIPLSKNFNEIGKRGTRHSAALGLSERSDAFILVVSEEKGTISVARNGRLRVLAGPAEAITKMNIFLKEVHPEVSVPAGVRFFKSNYLEKLGAICIALLIWYFSLFQAETMQRDFQVPVVYRSVPEGLTILSSEPREVTVTLAGRGQAAFNRLNVSTLEIAVEGRNMVNGENIITIRDGFLKKPPHIAVVNIRPSDIIVQAQGHDQIELPVHADLDLESLDENYVVRGISLSQEKVKVIIPQGQKFPTSIQTEPISLVGIESSISVVTSLVMPDGVRLKNNDIGQVNVVIQIERLADQ